MRCDRGTENSRIAYLQPFLRRDCHDQLAGSASFQYGRSASNQASFTAVICVVLYMQYYFRELSGGGASCEGGQLLGGLNFFRYVIVRQ